MGAGPFPHCRRIPPTAAASPSLRPRRLIGGLRGRAGAAGTPTRSQPPTRSGQLIEMGLAQVEFVAGGAVVHSNCRHGLGAVTVKITDKHDPCCLGHNSSLQRHTTDEPLAAIPNSNGQSISPRSGWPRATARMAPTAEHRHPTDDDLVEDAHVEALLDGAGHALSTPSVIKVNGASSRDQPSRPLWVTTSTGTLRDLTQRDTPAGRLPELTESVSGLDGGGRARIAGRRAGCRVARTFCALAAACSGCRGEVAVAS
jgi:hypothetical protein